MNREAAPDPARGTSNGFADQGEHAWEDRRSPGCLALTVASMAMAATVRSRRSSHESSPEKLPRPSHPSCTRRPERVLAIRIRYNPVDRASGAVFIQDIDQTVMA